MTYPAWATPKRRMALLRLWAMTDLRCLQGHWHCQETAHYIDIESKVVVVGEEIEQPLLDKDGARQWEPENEDGGWECSQDGAVWTKVMGGAKTVKAFRVKRSVIRTEKHRHLYEKLKADLKAMWIQEDRDVKAALSRREAADLHHMPDNKGWGRRYDPVQKDIFFAQQPRYYVESIGIDPLTHQKFAKIRVSSSSRRLFVALPQTTYNARKRLRRQGLLPLTIDQICQKAAEEYTATLVGH